MADDRAATLAYAVDNLTRGLTLAGHIEVAQTSAARRRGLLDVEDLSAESGLWIMPCEAVHTFGMKVSLDAIFLDREFKVRKVATNLPPRRISFCLSAESVLEVQAGTVLRTGTKLGDRLQFRRITNSKEAE